MKRSIVVVSVLAALAAAGSQAADRSARAQPKPAAKATAAQGGQVFMQTCSVCHLPPGGGAQLAPRLSRTSMGGSEEGIKTVVANGLPDGMPAFRSLLTEAEIAAVAAYVKGLN